MDAKIWQRETELITLKVEEISLNENTGVTIVREILAKVMGDAIREVEMDVDTCYDMEIGNETGTGIGMDTNNGNHGVSNNKLEARPSGWQHVRAMLGCGERHDQE